MQTPHRNSRRAANAFNHVIEATQSATIAVKKAPHRTMAGAMATADERSGHGEAVPDAVKAI